MEIVSVVILIAMVAIVFFFMRGNAGGRMRCNRCDGTGQVSERWPDPNEPGGWHNVQGTCPKCKGKGKI